MKFTYKTQGTCSRSIDIEIENGVVTDISFLGGCNGNLKGISELVKGLPIDQVINKLSGIKCGFKSTSCPDQLAKALIEYKNNN